MDVLFSVGHRYWWQLDGHRSWEINDEYLLSSKVELLAPYLLLFVPYLLAGITNVEFSRFSLNINLCRTPPGSMIWEFQEAVISHTLIG